MPKRWYAKPRSNLRKKRRKPSTVECWCDHCFPLDAPGDESEEV